MADTTTGRPLGELIRSQRRMAQMSLRRLAELSAVSNPYLSQIERGVHEPSFRVLQAVADALDVSTESLLRGAGMLPQGAAPGSSAEQAAGSSAEPPAGSSAAGPPAVELAVAADPRLSEAQKRALVSVYRSYVGDA